VRFAARIPAVRATSSIGPLGPSPARIRGRIPAGKRTSARASALRSPGSFEPTSTIRARGPEAVFSTWLESGSGPREPSSRPSVPDLAFWDPIRLLPPVRLL